ncbi:MAG: UDP-N-acetylmuramoyl-L-alanine--D-glutamate ligase [Gammaproteobacteria bacterium]|nr:UDP-N-acetylmuramoyl-L-alanine--D-glutamate ligase [Gammaproteobacteria bacterium]
MVDNLYVIVGLGATGFSCVRHLIAREANIAVTDSRIHPPQLDEFKKLYPQVPLSLGAIDEALLSKAHVIVVSPGISLQEPAIAAQIKRGVKVVGDVELFAQAANAPVIAITGTNAKSTVTTLVAQMAVASGLHVKVGGNLGVPALDLLTIPAPDLYVLELSSFQLDTTYSLKPAVATILNITPDHMDRYGTVEAYIASKQRVYMNCKIAVCNRDDVETDCKSTASTQKIFFTLSQPKHNEFGIMNHNGESYLTKGDERLMPVAKLPILGRHYQANALAALAIGYAFGFSMPAMLATLVEFKGLPHRCQLVRERNGVTWYNDSKGTNVGATLAAINGLGSEISGKLILIAGGVGKNADFSPLVPAIEKYTRSVILIGEAAPILNVLLKDCASVRLAKTMEEAVVLAASLALPGDSVLLSPACASFDMFNNFEHRGNVFTEITQELA